MLDQSFGRFYTALPGRRLFKGRRSEAASPAERRMRKAARCDSKRQRRELLISAIMAEIGDE
jgi:hypothetical protein